LYNKDKTILIQCPENKTGTVSIPNGVTSIRKAAFYFCRGLTGVNIPNSVISIEERVFSYCSSLTDITIPHNVTSIGERAFLWCNGIISITIPNSITSIEGGAFGWCDSLTSVTFAGTITAVNFSIDIDLGSGLIHSTFPGDLRDKFYEADATNGTPGTYTRPDGSSDEWERQP
jgi:hypothetical protein